jgi:hypothetical protein
VGKVGTVVEGTSRITKYSAVVCNANGESRC